VDTPRLDVKADFLYNVYQDWADGLDYQDEPISKIIRSHDITRSVCTLFVSEMIYLDEHEDYEYYINKSYDEIMIALEARKGSND
jgi:hypothetical protein